MKFKLGAEDLNAIAGVRLRVEENSKQIDDIVNDIIKPYCESLDEYVSFIASCLKDGTEPATTEELEDFCMNLSTYIYFACGLCENLGIRDDISKAIYKETYNESRASIDKGTVADKDSLAELNSKEEQITNICYSRAYKTMKAKVESAQELLSSCKKVLSHRMQAEELTRVGGN